MTQCQFFLLCFGGFGFGHVRQTQIEEIAYDSVQLKMLEALLDLNIVYLESQFVPWKVGTRWYSRTCF